MSRFSRRAMIVGCVSLALASCSSKPDPVVVEVPQPPKEVEVTSKADPINDSSSTGGESEAPKPMDDGQIETAIEQLRNGVLTWANQKSDESEEDRLARLKPYVLDDSSAASDGSVPFIQLDGETEEDEISEYQSTSGMIQGAKEVSSTPNTIIVDYQLRVVTEIAPLMEDGSHPDPVQGSPYNYTVRVSGEWNGEEWLISHFSTP